MYIDQGLAMLQAIGVRLARHIFLTGAIRAEEVKAIVQGVWKSFEIFQGFAPGETQKKGMIFGGSSGTVACHFSDSWWSSPRNIGDLWMLVPATICYW